MSMALNAGTRRDRRAAVAAERRASRTGDWGQWERLTLPNGIPGGDGWCREVRSVARNSLYVVLIRPVYTTWGTVHHLAIRTASNLEPPWRDKQRIKDELFGGERIAIEVMPPRSKLIDDADMYHMWVLATGTELPFGLSDEERAA